MLRGHLDLGPPHHLQQGPPTSGSVFSAVKHGHQDPPAPWGSHWDSVR